MTKEAVAQRLREAGIATCDADAETMVARSPAPEVVADWVERRVAGEPVEQVMERTRFLGALFHVLPGTLAPRAETELVAKAALAVLENLPGPVTVIDVCCGVGNIGITIALRRPEARVWMADLTEPCASATEKNIAALGVGDQVTVKQGDLFEPLRGLGLEGAVDLITCNPPYISTGRLAGDSAHLLTKEPREAFDAGPYGMKIHQRVINEAPAFLKPGARLAFEFGLGQRKQLEALFARSRRYDELTFFKNGAGEDRAACARFVG